ncbi:MAG: transglutaminase-like cysteine peptidase, partial [Halieaceae bacterium]
AVNDFFNTRIRWVQDPEAWGQKDYWATPLETMAKRMGDCEDFAIAKYATLILAGVDVNKLRITYVKARMGGAYSKIHEAHMVLAYYPTPSGMPEILDNLITDVRPASQRTDLKPVYGFNSNGLWVGGAAAPATKDPGAKLSRWRDLLQRAAAEGLG